VEYIAQQERSTDTTELSGSGPVIVWADPVPTRLLYLRRIWRLELSPASLADALQGTRGTARFSDSRESRWLDAWNQAWEINDLVQHATFGGLGVIADQEPREWFIDGGPEGFDDDEYLSWQRSLPQGGGGFRELPIAQKAEHAAARGLRSVYVVPVEDLWWSRRSAILAMSYETFASDEALSGALDAF
jgi:hypothetical protein